MREPDALAVELEDPCGERRAQRLFATRQRPRQPQRRVCQRRDRHQELAGRLRQGRPPWPATSPARLSGSRGSSPSARLLRAAGRTPVRAISSAYSGSPPDAARMTTQSWVARAPGRRGRAAERASSPTSNGPTARRLSRSQASPGRAAREPAQPAREQHLHRPAPPPAPGEGQHRCRGGILDRIPSTASSTWLVDVSAAGARTSPTRPRWRSWSGDRAGSSSKATPSASLWAGGSILGDLVHQRHREDRRARRTPSRTSASQDRAARRAPATCARAPARPPTPRARAARCPPRPRA